MPPIRTPPTTTAATSPTPLHVPSSSASSRSRAEMDSGTLLAVAGELAAALRIPEKSSNEKRKERRDRLQPAIPTCASVLAMLASSTRDTASMPAVDVKLFKGWLTEGTQPLPHQLQAVEWMRSRENREIQVPTKPGQPHVQFWDVVKRIPADKPAAPWPLYRNLLTGEHKFSEPALSHRGGILADEMGLGKSFSMLLLIVLGIINSPFEGPTLIVVPASLLSNWEREIARHFVAGRIIVHVHHGARRFQHSYLELDHSHIILTTYETLARDRVVPPPLVVESKFESEKDRVVRLFSTVDLDAVPPPDLILSLNDVLFDRIVFDEIHHKSNEKTQVFEALLGLSSHSRWMLTGTPVTNSIKEMRSLFQLLRVVEPLSDPQVWNQMIGVGPDSHKSDIYLAATSDTVLRRTATSRDKDGKRLIDPLTIRIFSIPIPLSTKGREVYDRLGAAANGTCDIAKLHHFKVSSGSCQIAADPRTLNANTIVAVEAIEQARDVDTQHNVVKSGTPRQPKAPSRPTAGAPQLDCPNCDSALDDPVSNECGQILCRVCFVKIRQEKLSCMLCEQVHDDDPMELVNAGADHPKSISTASFANLNTSLDLTDSPKIQLLIKLLRAKDLCNNSEDISLVFAYSTQLLDLVGKDLAATGIPSSPYDGRMSLNARTKLITTSIKSSKSPTTSRVRVLLVSLEVGGLGLNLQFANVAYFLQPWWVPATHDQAIARIARMGQEKEVHVYNLYSTGTIEDNMALMHHKKQEIANNLFRLTENGIHERVQQTVTIDQALTTAAARRTKLTTA